MTNSMTTEKPPRTDLLGNEVHTSSVWIMSAALMAAWVAAHIISRRFLKTKPLKLAGFAVRTVLGTAAIWAFWQAAARHLVLDTSWPHDLLLQLIQRHDDLDGKAPDESRHPQRP